MMKKLLLALPLVAGASWAGTTYYSGAQTEAAYTRLLEQLNSNNAFVLKSTEYKAGIMESTAITEVRSTEASGQDIQFSLKHQINHSLVSVAPENPRFGAASIITTLLIDENYPDDVKEVLKSFESGEPFVATTEVAVDGATNSEIKINAFNHAENDSEIKTSASVINVITEADGNVSGDGVLKEILFSEGSDKKADMSNLTMSFNASKLEGDERKSPYFYDLNFDLKMDESTIVDRGNQVAHIKGVNYSLVQDLSSNEPSANFNVGVDSLEVEALPLKSFDAAVALTGFSVTEMMANEAFIEQFKTTARPEELLFSEKGLEIMRATFKPDTKMAIKLNAVSVDGDGDAAVDLWFTGNGSDDGYTGMVTAGDLAKSYAGTAVIDIDKSALMSTPLGGMLEHPMAQAYLTVTEDKVTLNATLEELILKLNEQIIPLELMAGEMLNMPLEALLQQM